VIYAIPAMWRAWPKEATVTIRPTIRLVRQLLQVNTLAHADSVRVGMKTARDGARRGRPPPRPQSCYFFSIAFPGLGVWLWILPGARRCQTAIPSRSKVFRAFAWRF